MIRLRGVTADYGEEPVLQGLDLEVPGGELVACVGPSGSGKSTLLSVIAGLLTPVEGEVEVAGERLEGMTPAERAAFRRAHVAFVFQSFNLLPYLSARQNVEVPLYLCRQDRAQQRQRAQELLDRMGLNGKSVRLPSQLSVGEQQRVAVARALANRPQVLLADEPTGNLDRQNGNQVMATMHEVARDGVAVVVVTHDPEVANLAHRTVTMTDGRISS